MHFISGSLFLCLLKVAVFPVLLELQGVPAGEENLECGLRYSCRMRSVWRFPVCRFRLIKIQQLLILLDDDFFLSYYEQYDARVFFGYGSRS